MNKRRGSKQNFSVLITASFIFNCNILCFAEENINKTVQQATQAGLAGAVMGAVVIAFNRKTDDNTNYLDIGTHGRASVDRMNSSLHHNSNMSFAFIENGKVSFGFPAIIPDLQDRGVRGTPVVITAEIIRGNF